MNRQTEAQKAKNRFCFQGIEPDQELETKANLKLIQLLALAPPGANASGVLEPIRNSYLAKIEVQSPFRSFSSQAMGNSPHVAINRALERLEDQLFRWRFGSGNGNFGPHRNSVNAHFPWVRSN